MHGSRPEPQTAAQQPTGRSRRVVLDNAAPGQSKDVQRATATPEEGPHHFAGLTGTNHDTRRLTVRSIQRVRSPRALGRNLRTSSRRRLLYHLCHRACLRLSWIQWRSGVETGEMDTTIVTAMMSVLLIPHSRVTWTNGCCRNAVPLGQQTLVFHTAVLNGTSAHGVAL